ncbi:hypothetical protein A3H22_02705 [Candidatus Peribacteria bacterium RIFCSPLOWO2_12_FULL_55_15]|nr:MAG: hypothetical protein A2789_04090 [Candidatus Peribacteria bacterium RIFCSPHIGHO2_01_FULL_54_22]OGJ63257.1 MAG: hypothetical protein A3D12_02915 [Candidatus Peribacteria bacterium RIFCSPHIGHO2_02_FULL_55_24]OGJ63779.1 MAG: hypothetical protein A3E47_00035 [Candidatus Peribacteria bacterium RIFCSPHIGHO2_12_FULL_54_10]OGJ70116.1 MAG: hypothetical protein A3H90_03310 [Candidatus Peribacteria bacterium RIFCSPLOWO2_02_FULL_55_36]OGJ70568.1 MAG: hypothetical protein A3H22_02705 [Candidatus Per
MKNSPPIIGHHAQIAELLENIATGNVAHAYLFSGQKSVGKMTVARWFARELLLQGAEATREDIIRQIDCLVHPDLLVLDQLWIEGVLEDWHVLGKSSNVPQEHRSKATKARTDTIGIDDIRGIHDRLHGTGTGRYRCCIIRSIERMKEPAANALLKMFEEPPEGRVFLLTTEQRSLLLPTVISRARVIPFFPVASSVLRPLLQGIPSEDHQFCLHVAQGAPGVLQRFRMEKSALQEQRLLRTQAFSFFSARPSERQKILENFGERRQELRFLLFHIALALRELRPPAFLRWSHALPSFVQNLDAHVNYALAVQQFVLTDS